MKVKRLIAYIHPIFTVVVHLCLCIQVNAQIVPAKELSDSLQTRLLHDSTKAEKIRTLNSLISLYWQLPEEVAYTKQIIDIAEEADSMAIAYDAMADLCRYYLNDDNMDSLLYWKNRLDSICHIKKVFPDAIFRAGNIICRKHLSEANYELAMNEALQQLSSAEKAGNRFGIMSSNQNLGLIYQAVRRDSEAVNAFKEGLKWAEETVCKPGLIMTFIADMTISTLRTNDLEATEELLQKYLNICNAEIEKYKVANQEYPRNWHLWKIYSFYTELYTREGKPDKAKAALDKATFYIQSEKNESIKCPYYQAQAYYYQEIKDYSQALLAIEKALALEDDLNLLKRQVDVLRASGQGDKAMELYEVLLKKNSEISNEAFNRQIKQLRILNDLNDKHEQERALLYQNEQYAVQQHLLLIAVVFLIILLFFVYFLNRYYRNTTRLKDELQNEKESLVASERLLQVAKEEAEKANRDKTAFIANISHEVRTPLNAIVGFSELLAEQNASDAFTEEDRQMFASSINQNSEVLMNLVNDVLELSRLESANFQCTFNQCDMVECCREMIADTEPRLAEGVRITLTTPVDSLIIKTDKYRSRQLISKLLMNAAKFTAEGEVNLTIDIKRGEARFIVSDTGCGIPLEKQTQIFERFEKLDDFAQGTGLGLPICQLIASKLGGSLTIDPAYTQGARFVFVHPILEDTGHES